MTITAFPSNTTSITINGIAFTNLNDIQTAYPNGIPTNNAGVPTVPILIDPIDGGVTVVIPYTVTDNAGLKSESKNINVPFGVVTIAGTIFNDQDAGYVNNSSNTTIIPSGIYANLVDTNGIVIQSVSVNNTTGRYTFNEVHGNNYNVILSSIQGTVNQSVPSSIVPENWSLTGSYIGPVNTGNSNFLNGYSTGIVVSDLQNIDSVNFCIQQLPESAVAVTDTVINPGGFAFVEVPGTNPFATSSNQTLNPNTQDYDNGSVDSIRITEFPANTNAITIGTTTYINGGNYPTGFTCVGWTPEGVVTTYNNCDPAISIDPLINVDSVAIEFAAIDNAGSVTIPFNSLSLSAKVMNDTNALVDLIVNGGGIGSPTSTQLYAYLVDSVTNKVVGIATVASDGTYTFAEVVPNTNYSVVISTATAVMGDNTPTVTLPTNWVATGEHNALTGGNDGTPNGSIKVSVGTENVTNINFGIEQKPVAEVKEYYLNYTPL